jgi:hypothetical protein
MTRDQMQSAFAPLLDDIGERSRVAERFLSRDLYQLNVATLWANVVLDPEDIGMSEADLPLLHDVLNDRLSETLGRDCDLHTCFRFINSKAGERAMAEARLNKNHQDLLLYFASMILDPEGHKRWMDEIQSRPPRR